MLISAAALVCGWSWILQRLGDVEVYEALGTYALVVLLVVGASCA